ncbi:hypothetical protein [Hymenobacter metallicola]|uniref:DUF4384 domain-containing protein n=1 Tax=Hymenobacter metallicola TaxID=2563114 RepID=A0A4Z0Q123_9BACT|nr:hypothetical protein [Hymenobacter metallicola]TGE22863.1 hypothetical protein E5K02_21105 [Hymenobacter metallicola]
MPLSTRFWCRLLSLVICGLFTAQVQAQVYYLDLSRQRLTLPERTLQVEQVVDGRPGHPTIGLVYRGLDNRPAAVLFRNGLESELQTFLQKQLPARPADHAVVLCLRELRISEQLGGLTEVASADLAADVYEHLPGGGYYFVRTVAARTSNRALETTAQHPEHIALLLQRCLGQITATDWAQTKFSPARTLAQLAADNPVAATPDGKRVPLAPILREVPRRGIFYTFEQFLANRPDSILPVRADTIPLRLRGSNGRLLWSGVARFRPVAPNGHNYDQPVGKMAWGFSDGQQLYVQHNKQYFPLMRQGNFFTFVGEKPLDVEYMRARSDAQARAMVTGVATVRAPNHTGEPTPYAVDMRTGQSAPYPNPLRARPARPDTTYVYLYRAADASPAPITVFVEGKEVGKLLPNEYLELPWPYYARMLRLCLEVATPNPCQLLVPNAAQLNYLKISATPATPGAPLWQWVTAAQGEADLDALDKLRKASAK